MRLRSAATRWVAATSIVVLAAAGLAAAPGATAAPGTADPGPGGLSLGATQPTVTGRASADKAPSSALAQTPAGLKRLTSPAPVAVMIKYDYDAAASYTGTVAGLAATSPDVTDTSLSEPTAATSAYLDYVGAQEATISADVTRAVPQARITGAYQVVYGGVSAVVPGNAVRDLLKVPGVVAVQRDTLRKPLTDSSTDFVNADAVYRELHTTRNAGQGVLLGNLDSGVWPEHPSLADQGNLPAYTGPALPCDYGDNPLTPAVDPFQCTNKLVGGAAFVDTYNAVNGTGYLYADSARDSEGHGSHTATTSAGNVVRNVQTIGPLLRQINGMAPGAQVMEYRVCGPTGCFGSDSAAAVQQAILDGVKVINFSISGGTSPLTDPVELAFLDAYNAGVFVSTSAGNDGPTAGTANHLSPWVTTVAASTQTRAFSSTLTLTSGGDTFTTTGSSIMPGAGPLPLVVASAAPYSAVRCDRPAAAGTFTGKIVVCERGGNGRVEKGYNVSLGGAAGMILYNPALADTETDNHFLPAVHLADGTALRAFLAAHANVTASFTAGRSSTGRGDVMAAFSSRGPAGDFLKPDITAPGVQILAAMTPTPNAPADGPAGQYYQAIAGTSMSSPHVAGAALLLNAAHPDWTPGEIKSAIMTQAPQQVVKEDEVTPADPFDMGSGRLDVGRASDAPLTVSASAADFAALTGDPVRRVDLNLPSINAPTMPGRLTTVRTVRNMTSGRLKVTPRAETPEGTTITFSPESSTVPRGGTASFSITIDSSAPLGEQQFAEVRFRTSKGTAHLPVAFVPGQASVTLDQACAAPSIKRLTSTTCTVTATNEGADPQRVALRTSSADRTLTLTRATGARLERGTATTTATLSGAAPGVPSVGPGTSPAGGYLDLGLFGIAPEAIGDEAIVNFDVPAFTYNGRVEDRIGVTSNGYAVVGGGDSADLNCCNLPAGASPNAPNNLLAPLWTDLDGTGAPGISVGSLTDGVDSWTVVQWAVRVYGTADVRSFQVWIGTNGVQDVSFTYSAPQADPNAQPFLVGAENAAGQGDVTAVLPDGTDQVVTSTAPTPGGSVSYTVTVRGERRGTGTVHSEMDASGVSGTTVVNTPITVTP